METLVFWCEDQDLGEQQPRVGSIFSKKIVQSLDQPSSQYRRKELAYLTSEGRQTSKGQQTSKWQTS